MISPKLMALERQLKLQTERKTQAPAADSLALAIQELVEREVTVALARHRERPRQAPRTHALLKELSRAAPVIATAPEAPPGPSVRGPTPIAREISFQRDELGRVNLINAGTLQFHLLRDGLGRINRMNADTIKFNVQRGVDGRVVRLVPADVAPPTPGIPPAPLNRR